MTPIKRALSESSSNKQAAPKRNRVKAEEATQSENGDPMKEENQADDSEFEREEREVCRLCLSKSIVDSIADIYEKLDELPDDNSEYDELIGKLDPYSFICIDQQRWLENDDPNDDQGDERPGMMIKPAAEHPTWKWIMLWRTWEMMEDWTRFALFTNADAFGINVYTDFHWYGLAECIENLLAEFEKARNKYEKVDGFVKQKTLLDMWAPLAALAHWISEPKHASFYMMDDGPRCCRLVGLIGSAFITMLDTIDQEGQLKPDGAIKDIGLVSSLFLKFGTGLENYGIEDEEAPDGAWDWEEPTGGSIFKWRRLLVAYAKKGKIDLVATGCGGTRDILLRYHRNVTAKEVKGAAKYVDWTNVLQEYEEKYSTDDELGGNQYCILNWSREERAEASRNGQDPLGMYSDEELRHGAFA